MTEPTPMEKMQAQIDALKEEVAKLEAKPSFWEGLSNWLAANPKTAHLLNAVLVSAATWALTYFSVPATRTVYAPEPVAEVKAEDKGRAPTVLPTPQLKPKD
jgi:hypothetical protein